MKKTTLILMTSVAIMTLGIASKSWAATSGCNCGSMANGGDASDCCWKIEDGVLTIYPNPERSSTGNVTMKDFNGSLSSANKANGYTSEYSSNALWQRQGVTSVVVEKGISNIGKFAFYGDTKITSVTGMENVTSIGNYAFHSAKSLQSVDMPNVTSIGERAFFEARSLQSVDMPNVTSIGIAAFDSASSLSYAGLNQDESVSVSIGDYAFFDTGITSCNGTKAFCGSCNGQSVMPGRGCVADCGTGYIVDNLTNRCVANAQTEPTNPSGGDTGGSQESEQQGTQGSGSATSAADCKNNGQYWQEGKCVSSCGASFKLNDGWCDRLRYTPAEAAQVLKDDNTNSVTITFKK